MKQIFLIKNEFRNSEIYIVADDIVKAINIYIQKALEEEPEEFDEDEISEVKNLGFCLIGE